MGGKMKQTRKFNKDDFYREYGVQIVCPICKSVDCRLNRDVTPDDVTYGVDAHCVNCGKDSRIKTDKKIPG